MAWDKEWKTKTMNLKRGNCIIKFSFFFQNPQIFTTYMNEILLNATEKLVENRIKNICVHVDRINDRTWVEEWDGLMLEHHSTLYGRRVTSYYQYSGNYLTKIKDTLSVKQRQKDQVKKNQTYKRTHIERSKSKGKSTIRQEDDNIRHKR